MGRTEINAQGQNDLCYVSESLLGKLTGGTENLPIYRGSVNASRMNVSEYERTELLEGGAARFDNQVAWASFYLVKEGIIDSSRRGVWSLSDKGRAIESLSHFFQEFQS